ncbi:MAG: sulfatase, partial [Mariniblastus sp.]|nr:sulfatase [Mariniblastus sp.]
NRPYLQPCRYKDAKAMLVAIRQWNAEGKLNEAQKLLMQKVRPAEELYDLRHDPHEINNLADDLESGEKLNEMRLRLDQWMETSGDQGRQPEPAEMYDSDMAAYLKKLRGPKSDPAQLQALETNIALMKKWAAEGK